MAHQDPDLKPNCPKCGKPLPYVSSLSSGPGAYAPGDEFNTKVDLHYYECAEHGSFHIGTNGQLYPGP
jgi:hypothetical protein